LEYTGVEDTNGLEIYERDIVVHGYGVYTEVITFVYGSFGSINYHMEDIGSCEVIGNIYENPELIEV
jgi:hypothetical protein